MTTTGGRSKKRPTKSEDGAVERLISEIPTLAAEINALDTPERVKAVEEARDAAYGVLKQTDYELWNGQLVIAIWRLEGRIPNWTAPTFVGETPETL